MELDFMKLKDVTAYIFIASLHFCKLLYYSNHYEDIFIMAHTSTAFKEGSPCILSQQQC